MHRRQWFAIALAGLGAGAVNGMFGGGGGMVLVPLLGMFGQMRDEEIFPSSVSIILPICVTSLAIAGSQGVVVLVQAFPYLIGSALGGIAAGIWGRKIPTALLHRALGVLILWGGIRYLC